MVEHIFSFFTLSIGHFGSLTNAVQATPLLPQSELSSGFKKKVLICDFLELFLGCSMQQAGDDNSDCSGIESADDISGKRQLGT